jgi:hypothetical protein
MDVQISRGDQMTNSEGEVIGHGASMSAKSCNADPRRVTTISFLEVRHQIHWLEARRELEFGEIG